MNTFCFTGNLGKDCRVGSIPSGTTVCNFSVAVQSGYGQNQKDFWVDCALWGKRAEGKLPEYLTTGTKVAISGELSTQEKDGKTYLKCRVDSLDLIGSRSESGNTPEQAKPQSQAQDDPFDSEDCPF